MGPLVSARFELGHNEVTRDFVPIWLLGAQTNGAEESEVLSNPAGAGTNVDYYRWKLPRPLFMPAGHALTAQFVRDAGALDTITGAITVDVAYVGKALPSDTKTPTLVAVPYAASYRHPFGTTQSESGSAIGTAALCNGFERPLHVQRLTGRIAIQGARELVWSIAGLANAFAVVPVQVKIADTHGYGVVPNFTPFNDVFVFDRRAWTSGQDLLPKERYHVQLVNVAATWQPMIGLIGWREEVLS
jgi:hypothetical protein